MDALVGSLMNASNVKRSALSSPVPTLRIVSRSSAETLGDEPSL